jgi:hypothetical protein
MAGNTEPDPNAPLPPLDVRDDRPGATKEAELIVNCYRARDKFTWHEDWVAWCREMGLSPEQVQGITDAS